MIAAFILELEAKGELPHPTPGLVLAALKRIERMLERMDQEITDAFAAARQAAAAEHDQVVAVVGLLTALEQQLQGALNSGNSAEEIVNSVAQITQAITSDKDALAAAVAQGTTPTPPPPPPGDATDPTA